MVLVKTAIPFLLILLFSISCSDKRSDFNNLEDALNNPEQAGSIY